MLKQNLNDALLIWGEAIPSTEKLLEGDPGLLDVPLNVADLVLRKLKEVATATPIAHLKELCGGSLVILNTVQDVRNNKADFRRLAQDAVCLAYSISQSSKHAEDGLPEDLQTNLIPLLKTLHAIYIFSEHRKKRKQYMWIIYSQADKGKIQEYRDMLNQSMANFGIKSNISIQQTVVELLKKHDQLITSIEQSVSMLGTQERVDGFHHTVAELVEKNDKLLAAIQKANREEAEKATLRTLPVVKAPSSEPTRPSISNAFGKIQTSSSTVTITNVTGDYTFSDNSVTTTNSDSNNQKTTITNNSNNSGYDKPGKRRGQGVSWQ